MYIYISLASIFSGLFFYIDGPNILNKNLIEKPFKLIKNRKKTFNNIKLVLYLFLYGLWIASKIFWVKYIQCINKTIHKLDKNKYILTYTIEGNLYKMIVIKKRGPSNILLVLDENNKEISHLIEPYIGPEKNFHNKEITPSFFNKKEIIFEMTDGDPIVFNEKDVLKF